MNFHDFLAFAPHERGNQLLPDCRAQEEHDQEYALARSGCLDGQEDAQVPLGLDVHLHFGKGSRYELTDPQECEERKLWDVTVTRKHDGMCGFLMFEELNEERNRVRFKLAIADLLEQLPAASRQARRRAARQGRPLRPELHVGSSCTRGRHRGEMGGQWLAQLFASFVDVEDVEVRRHQCLWPTGLRGAQFGRTTCDSMILLAEPAT